MIIEYHRPRNLDEALTLLKRSHPKTIPLGGGSGISQGLHEPAAVVDLQDIGLDNLEKIGSVYRLGATARLQSLVEWGECPEQLRDVLEKEFTLNSRNVATVAGSLVRATSKSIFAGTLLAVDSKLAWEPGGIEIPLGDWLPLRGKWNKGRLMVNCTFNLPMTLKYEYVSRTPMDKSIVGVFLAQWSSGRTRLVLIGLGDSPTCVFDGTESAYIVDAALSACSHLAYNPQFEYKKEMVQLLTRRLIVTE